MLSILQSCSSPSLAFDFIIYLRGHPASSGLRFEIILQVYSMVKFEIEVDMGTSKVSHAKCEYLNAICEGWINVNLPSKNKQKIDNDLMSKNISNQNNKIIMIFKRVRSFATSRQYWGLWIAMRRFFRILVHNKLLCKKYWV